MSLSFDSKNWKFYAPSATELGKLRVFLGLHSWCMERAIWSEKRNDDIEQDQPNAELLQGVSFEPLTIAKALRDIVCFLS